MCTLPDWFDGERSGAHSPFWDVMTLVVTHSRLMHWDLCALSETARRFRRVNQAPCVWNALARRHCGVEVGSHSSAVGVFFWRILQDHVAMILRRIDSVFDTAGVIIGGAYAEYALFSSLELIPHDVEPLVLGVGDDLQHVPVWLVGTDGMVPDEQGDFWVRLNCDGTPNDTMVFQPACGFFNTRLARAQIEDGEHTFSVLRRLWRAARDDYVVYDDAWIHELEMAKLWCRMMYARRWPHWMDRVFAAHVETSTTARMIVGAAQAAEETAKMLQEENARLRGEVAVLKATRALDGGAELPAAKRTAGSAPPEDVEMNETTPNSPGA